MLRYFHYLIILIFAESRKDSAPVPESYLNEIAEFICLLNVSMFVRGNYQ